MTIKEKKTWDARLDICGKVANFAGRSLSDCPFRYQGQYEDSETGLTLLVFVMMANMISLKSKPTQQER
jgi:hypothetical protein